METLSRSRLICRLRFGWRAIPQGPRDSLPMIEHRDSGTDRDVRFRPGSTCRPVHQLLLEETVPGFPQGVIVTMSFATPARGHAGWLKPFWVRRGGLGAAAIRVRPHAGRRPAVHDRAGSGPEHAVGRHAPIPRPSPRFRVDKSCRLAK
jgi:hypothetical protein